MDAFSQYGLLDPGPSIHTYELGLTVPDLQEFQTLWKRLQREYPCDTQSHRMTLTLAGLEVVLCQHKDGSGSIYLKVNPLKLLDATVNAAQIIPPDKKQLHAAWKELKRRLRALKLPDDPDDYRVTRVDCCVNVLAEKNGFVREQLRLSRKRLTPSFAERHLFWDKRLSEKENRACNHDYYCIQTRRGTLVMYDKHKQGLRCHLLGVEQMPKSVLRVEWQLDGDGLSEMRKRFKSEGEALVTDLALHSGDVFKELLPNLYHCGIYLGKEELLAAIETCDCKEKNRQRMADYVRLAGKYGEDKAAEKYMKKYKCGKKTFLRMRKRFEELNIQPVPLRKNYHGDALEPLEVCLLRLLKEA